MSVTNAKVKSGYIFFRVKSPMPHNADTVAKFSNETKKAARLNWRNTCKSTIKNTAALMTSLLTLFQSRQANCQCCLKTHNSVKLKILYLHYVWKSQKKSHSTLRAKRATFTFWVDKSKNAQNDPFWRVFINLKLAVKQCYQTGQF